MGSHRGDSPSASGGKVWLSGQNVTESSGEAPALNAAPDAQLKGVL